MQYQQFFSSQLGVLKNQGNYREFNQITRAAGLFPSAYLKKKAKNISVWCSNDYLAMGENESVIKAVCDSAHKYGAGAGGTRNISGNHASVENLEQYLAYHHSKESALVFNSGYMANMASIATLASNLPDCLVFSDEKNHASIIEGIRHSRAEKHIFRHNDISHLEELLKMTPRERAKLIIFESVYSMDGDFGKIAEIADLAKKYNAITYLDEVHAVGIYGKYGQGVASKLGVAQDIDIIQGTFGKAYGLIGGYITADAELIDFIRSFAKGFIFTTTIPPMIADGAMASIEYVRSHPKLIDKFHKQTLYMKNQLQNAGISFMETSQSHIIPIKIGDAVMCKEISDMLMEKHSFYVQSINFPTVPRNTERLRITLTPKHTNEMIDEFVMALKHILQNVKMPA